MQESNERDGRITSKTGRCAIVPVWLLGKVSLRALELFVLLAGEYADYSTGEAEPKRREIAGRLGVTTKTVDAALAELVKVGAVEKHVRKSAEHGNLPSLLVIDITRPAGKGGEADVARVGRETSPPSLQKIKPQSERAPSGALSLREGKDSGGVVSDRPLWKVDRWTVSDHEDSLARQVLAEWNQQTGQNLTAKTWLAKIVMRIREHPTLGIEEHAHVISVALRDPWWRGPSSPSVIYGNDAQFERSITAATSRDRSNNTSADIRALAQTLRERRTT